MSEPDNYLNPHQRISDINQWRGATPPSSHDDLSSDVLSSVAGSPIGKKF